MYNIYSKGHRLVLAGADPAPAFPWTVRVRYHGKPKALFPVIDLMEKREDPQDILVIAEDPEAVWRDFRELFSPVEAAGGLVADADGRLLFILRNGYLDLPKGKLDPGEDHATAALREVLEETGVGPLRSLGEAATTWHIYKEGKKRFLKRTIWFVMQTGSAEGTPQQEEGISALLWLTPLEYDRPDIPRFRNLTDMLSDWRKAAGSADAWPSGHRSG